MRSYAPATASGAACLATAAACSKWTCARATCGPWTGRPSTATSTGTSRTGASKTTRFRPRRVPTPAAFSCALLTCDTVSKGILNLFPTARQTPAPPAPAADDDTLAARLAALHAHTVALPADADDAELVRPGEAYLYKAQPDDEPTRMRTLLQAVADFLAVERADLQHAVHTIEAKLQAQMVLRRREVRERAKLQAAERAQRQEDEGVGEEIEVAMGGGDMEVEV